VRHRPLRTVWSRRREDRLRFSESSQRVGVDGGRYRYALGSRMPAMSRCSHGTRWRRVGHEDARAAEE